MRIVHWYPNFLDGGAVTNTVAGLADAQAALGEDVVVVAAASTHAGRDSRFGLGPAVRLSIWEPAWTVHTGGVLVRRLSRAGSEQIAELRPDIVHVHAEFNADNLWAPRLFAAPLVLSPRGALHPLAFRKSKPLRKRAYFTLASRLLYRRATIHALTPAEGESISRLLPGAQIYCAPQGPGVRAVLLESTRAGEPARGPVRFLYSGRLDVFMKGLDVLLDAYALVRRRLGEESRLVLVGPDDRGGRGLLERQARALGIADAVEFAGGVPGETAVGLVAGCDVYVQLSRYEGLPSSVTEALVCGKPSVLSDSVGTVSYPEIAALPHIRVVPLEAGRAAEAMVAVARARRALCAEAAAVQPQVDEFFSWERAARMHLDAYRDLA